MTSENNLYNFSPRPTQNQDQLNLLKYNYTVKFYIKIAKDVVSIYSHVFSFSHITQLTLTLFFLQNVLSHSPKGTKNTTLHSVPAVINPGFRKFSRVFLVFSSKFFLFFVQIFHKAHHLSYLQILISLSVKFSEKINSKILL